MKSILEKPFFNEYKKMKIAVVGDAILDRYVWGDVKRTSPEAPVPVLKVKSEQYIMGGACNVANNIRAMGAMADFYSVVGDDSHASTLTSLLDEGGIQITGLMKDPKRQTILKTRMIAMGQQLIRIDEEEVAEITKSQEEELLKRLKRNIGKYRGIIISDYGKGVLTKNLTTSIIRLANANQIKVIGDPKGRDYSKYSGVFSLTPNVLETETALEMNILSEDDLEKAGAKLISMLGSETAVITRGAEGVAIFERGKNMVLFKARAREVYDVSGAGDTFISHYGMGLFSGLPADKAAELGNYAASLVVEKVGVAVVSPEELSGFISGEVYKSKFSDEDSLERMIKALKNKGKKVVFTNGCFDLIHVGHIRFLQEARRLGDCLVVALNSDKSVRRIKGEPRPILAETDRVHLISAIEGVDYVVLFEEDEPVKLIKKLKPDILVKGKNIPPDMVVGKETVEKYGGKVVRLPLYHDLSTSKIIDDIAKSAAKPRKR